MARLLLVNDERDLVDICELVLEEAGHDVDTLTHGRMAAETAKQEKPDLIILDWLMKDATGQEVFRQLRTEPSTTRIPVLMISAIPDGQMTARLYGLDAFLKKPFTADELKRAVERLLAETRDRRELHAPGGGPRRVG